MPKLNTNRELRQVGVRLFQDQLDALTLLFPGKARDHVIRLILDNYLKQSNIKEKLNSIQLP